MFIKHDISEEDLITGCKFTELQTKVLQNRMIELAEELLTIVPAKAENYDLKYHYLQGQLHELKSLIQISEELKADRFNQGE